MNDHTVPPTPKGFSRTLILLIALVVAGGAGLAVVLGLQGSGDGEKTNTAVTSEQTNASSNTNSAVNTNPAVNNAMTNRNATEGWETFFTNKYSIQHSPTWRVVREGSVVSLLDPVSNSCWLRIYEEGLLGRNTEWEKAAGTTIQVAGKTIARRNWVDGDGAIRLFNFEIQDSALLLGIEGSSSGAAECEGYLEKMYATLSL